MEMLKIRLRFTPSYHPRGNYTERVNRFIGESLRTLVSMDGAKQSDWWKLTKFVEFAYRRMYIPGTNLTPFMVARGRQPTVPSELERLQTGGALPSMSSLDAHTQELQKHLQLATQLLAWPGASKNPLTPIDPKPRPRLADSQPESLSSRSPASVGQVTAPEGHPGAGLRLSVPDRQQTSNPLRAQAL